MRSFFKMFFASLLAMVVAGLIIVGVFVGLIISAMRDVAKPPTASGPSEKSILVIQTKDRIREQHEQNSLAAFTKDAAFESGLYNATTALQKAAGDKDISCIFIRANGSPNGYATLYQLREALLEFKKSGKPIYAYGESYTQKDYYLCSVADSIFLNPLGGFELKGLAAELEFYKGTLDKLGVEPEIFYAGKFKSATEPFRMTSASEPNKQQLAAVLQGIWQPVAAAAAVRSGVDPAVVNGWADSLSAVMAPDAARLKLVTGLRYEDEVDTVLHRRMEIASDKKVPIISLNRYAESVWRSRDLSSDRIAILFAEGEIVDGKGADYQIASEPFVKAIREIGQNDKIKALVLRVNSPGGSALASEVMLRELQLLRRKKPVIVSMGDVAASGGYYISCAADSVFALPNTITGSIGVFSMLFNLAPAALDKLGITFDVVRTHAHADFPTATRNLTSGEANLMQRGVDSIYAVFKSRVAVARGLAPENVDSIAQGRVWVGTDALRIGLVDGLGGLDRAIAAAASKAGLKSWTISTYPEPVDKFEAMLRRFQNSPIGAMVAQQALDQFMHGQFAKGLQQLQWLKANSGVPMMLMPAQLNVH